MKGIADGAAAAGARIFDRKVDLLDIVTANTTVELTTLRNALSMTPSGLEGLGFEPPEYAPRKRDPAVTERCSAFAATGPATADGKMVIGHITMWSLPLAELSNVMLDIQPAKVTTSDMVPRSSGSPVFQLTDLHPRLPTAMILYGTGPDAGANRHAAEELRRKFHQDMDPADVPVRKDFEVSEAELKDHDLIFIGRPESNSALARLAAGIGLHYDGEAFQLNGKTYASERQALMLAAANPLNPARMIIVIAGNSALETVRAASLPESRAAYVLLESGKVSGTGYVTPNQ
jgi:hypothetical protein